MLPILMYSLQHFEKMKNIAVILAGGIGRRVGLDVPKQFLDMGGRRVIEYPITTFCSHPAISEVAVVIHPDWRGELESLVAANDWPRLTKIIDGGAERYMSTLNAVMAYIDEPDDTNLLLHDAARPLVSTDIIDRVLAALQHNEAVGVAVPSTDTVWEVNAGGDNVVDYSDMSADMTQAQMGIPRLVARIPERRLMWRAQTPQAFRLPLLRDAYQRALQDPQFVATDDCGVVRHYMSGVKIAVVEGSERNMKLTSADDLPVLINYIEK